MATYRVRTGMTFGARDQYGPGDLVEIEDAAAQGFLDKLERVETPAEAQPPAAQESLEAPEMPVEAPIIINPEDGIDDDEASAASKALNQRKRK